MSISSFEQIASAKSPEVHNAAATSLGCLVVGSLRRHPENSIGVKFLLEKYAGSSISAVSKSVLSVRSLI